MRFIHEGGLIYVCISLCLFSWFTLVTLFCFFNDYYGVSLELHHCFYPGMSQEVTKGPFIM